MRVEHLPKNGEFVPRSDLAGEPGQYLLGRKHTFPRTGAPAHHEKPVFVPEKRPIAVIDAVSEAGEVELIYQDLALLEGLFILELGRILVFALVPSFGVFHLEDFVLVLVFLWGVVAL